MEVVLKGGVTKRTPVAAEISQKSLISGFEASVGKRTLSPAAHPSNEVVLPAVHQGFVSCSIVTELFLRRLFSAGREIPSKLAAMV